MKLQTEVRKQDIKKAVILIAVCVGVSSVFYVKWFKSARDRKIRVSRRIADVQATLQNCTRAEEELSKVEEKVPSLREAMREVESRLPSKTGLSGKCGKEIIDKLDENGLTLLSVRNSEFEKVEGELHKIEYTIELRGSYTDILSFINHFEKGFWEGFTKLQFTAVEGNFLEGNLTLVLYGIEKQS